MTEPGTRPPRTSPRRLLLLGTGTGVGKTWIGCAIAGALRRAGRPSQALKPIESGYVPATSDAARLAEAAGHPPVQPLYTFSEPISPHLAARRSGLAIELRRVRHWLDQHCTTIHYVLVESAGGALSPLGVGTTTAGAGTTTAGAGTANAELATTNAELALALGDAGVLLVAPDRLGVLHDLTSTLCALQQRGVSVDHVLLGRPPPHDASTGSNAAEIERLGIARVSAVIAGADDADRFVAGLP